VPPPEIEVDIIDPELNQMLILEKIKNEVTLDSFVNAFALTRVDMSQELVQKQIEQIEKDRGIQDMQTMSEMTRMSRGPVL